MQAREIRYCLFKSIFLKSLAVNIRIAMSVSTYGTFRPVTVPEYPDLEFQSECESERPEEEECDPEACLNWVCLENQPDVLDWVLAQSFFLPDRGDFVLRESCKLGHGEVVRILVGDPRIDPNNWDAFRWAVKKGHAECVQALLPYNDPARRHNWAIRHAGSAAVAKVLLADQRVDPTDGRAKKGSPIKKDALYRARRRGTEEVVHELLKDSRVTPPPLIIEDGKDILPRRENAPWHIINIDEISPPIDKPKPMLMPGQPLPDLDSSLTQVIVKGLVACNLT